MVLKSIIRREIFYMDLFCKTLCPLCNDIFRFRCREASALKPVSAACGLCKDIAAVSYIGACGGAERDNCLIDEIIFAHECAYGICSLAPPYGIAHKNSVIAVPVCGCGGFKINYPLVGVAVLHGTTAAVICPVKVGGCRVFRVSGRIHRRRWLWLWLRLRFRCCPWRRNTPQGSLMRPKLFRRIPMFLLS